MALTDTAIRLARPRGRVYRLNDGRGLCVLIQTNGAKWWRFRYRWNGREQMPSMGGTYPDTPLIEARKQRDAARQQLAQGINPAADRQRKRNPIDRSFEGVAKDWLACVLKLVLAGKRSRDTYEKAKNQLETYIVPELGREDVNSIRPSQLLSVLSITRPSRTRRRWHPPLQD